MNTAKAYIKGRGAQMRPVNRFDQYQDVDEQICPSSLVDEKIRTKYISVQPKTIINPVKSPDLNFAYSINPFQGCEHGCVYCYARNTHNYWGYSAGIDFEQTVLVKENASALLTKKLRSKHWKAEPIMLSGNTDCYQPIEREMGITRDLLKVFWEYRHPVQIITKNDLILRDLDYLKLLASENLVQVAISITSLDEDLRGIMEPRTSTSAKRLNAIKVLAENNIPVIAMIAPIIPSINDHEIFDLMKAISDAGAYDAKYVLVRLNGDVATIFKDWARKNFPDRADKVIRKVEACHGGTTEDYRFGKRMRGEGAYAEIIKNQYTLAKAKYLSPKPMPKLNTMLHQRFKTPQLQLFR